MNTTVKKWLLIALIAGSYFIATGLFYVWEIKLAMQRYYHGTSPSLATQEIFVRVISQILQFPFVSLSADVSLTAVAYLANGTLWAWGIYTIVGVTRKARHD